MAKWASGDVVVDRHGTQRVIVSVHRWEGDEDAPPSDYYLWRYPHSPETFDSRNCADNCENGWRLAAIDATGEGV